MQIEQSLLTKPLCIILHGKSCEILEYKIEQFKDLDVVWGSMSSFDLPQKYILNKIIKSLILFLIVVLLKMKENTS